MGLAFLTLCLLCAPPAQAQGPRGGGPTGPTVDPGHCWKTTYATSGGTSSMHYINGNQYNPPLFTSDTWGPTANGGGIGGQYAVDATASGTVTATMTWIPAAGKTLVTDPPSSPVHIIETASASWFATRAFANSGQDPFAGTDASDGLGDPKVSNEYGGGQTSRGVHLIQKDGLSGTIILDPVQMNANSPVYPAAIIWGYASAGATLNVCEDTSHTPRSVSISCPALDPTSYKKADPNTPTDANGDANYIAAPHLRAADGTMSGDVGLPIDSLGAVSTSSTNITYHANVLGIWQTAGSSYNWFSSLKQQGDNGSLYPPDFTNSYIDPWWDVGDPAASSAATTLAPGDTSSTADHINIKCIDSGDSAVATANYFMMVHPAIEKNYADHVHSDFINPRQVSVNLISSGPTDPLGGGTSVQIDYALSASADGSVAKLVAGFLGINVGFTVEKDFATVSTVGTIGLPAGWYTYVVEYDHYYDHYGKADNWNMSGYTGTSPYTIREVPSNEADRFGLQMAPPVRGTFAGGGQ